MLSFPPHPHSLLAIENLQNHSILEFSILISLFGETSLIKKGQDSHRVVGMSWNLPPLQGEKQNHFYFSFYIFCLFDLQLPHGQHSPCAGILPSVDFIGIVFALTPTCLPFLFLFSRSPIFFSIKIVFITCIYELKCSC